MERLTRDGLDQLAEFLEERFSAPGETSSAASAREVPALRGGVERAVVGIEEYLAPAAQELPSRDDARARTDAEALWDMLEATAALWSDHPRCPLPCAATCTDDASPGDPSGRSAMAGRMMADGILVYRLAGELDLVTVSTLSFDVPLKQAKAVVVDLTDVAFCDCTGLNALLRLRLDAADLGRPVHLAGVRDRVARLLELTGADSLFPLHATAQEAIAALR